MNLSFGVMRSLACSRRRRTSAAALLNYADDEGFFNANPELVAADCCPLREPTVSVPASLTALAAIEYIRLGTGSDGKRYGQIVTFLTHQRINRATTSKIKGMSIAWDDLVSPHAQVDEVLSLEGNRKGNREEEQGREPSSAGADVAAPRRSQGPMRPSSRSCGARQHSTTPKGSKKNAAAEWKRHVEKPGVNAAFVVEKAVADAECRRTDYTSHVENWIKGRR